MASKLSFIAGKSRAQLRESLRSGRIETRGALVVALVSRDEEARADQWRRVAACLDEGRPISDPARGIYFEDQPFGADSLAFLFPGQGTQRPEMTRAFEAGLPGYAEALQAVDKQWADQMGESLLGVLERSTEGQLKDTRLAQPAIGLVSVAATMALTELNIRPRFAAGHSYGELPALWLGGAMALPTLLDVTRARAKLMGAAGDRAPGAMAAIMGDPAAASSLFSGLETEVTVANLNGPSQWVASGTRAGVLAVSSRAREAGLSVVELQTSCAFHSDLMASMETDWRQTLSDKNIGDPSGAQVWSNALGAPYSAGSAKELLERQAREPVLWLNLISGMADAGARIFLEVGPGRTLAGLNRSILSGRPHLSLSLDPKLDDPHEHMCRVLAQLAAHGVEVQLQGDAPEAIQLAKESSIELAFAGGNQRMLERFFQHQQAIFEQATSADPAGRRELGARVLEINERVMTAFLGAAHPGAAAPQPVAEAPAKVPPSPDGWLQSKLAAVTGFPLDSLTGTCDFERELGLDSITLLEVYTEFSEAFPAHAEVVPSFRHCRCINDIRELLNREQTPSNGEKLEKLFTQHAASAELSDLPLSDRETLAEALVQAFPSLSIAGEQLIAIQNRADLVALCERILGTASAEEKAQAPIQRYVRAREARTVDSAAPLPKSMVVVGTHPASFVAALHAKGVTASALTLVESGFQTRTGTIDISDTDALAAWLQDETLPEASLMVLSPNSSADQDSYRWVDAASTGTFALAKAYLRAHGAPPARFSVVAFDEGEAAAGARGVARALAHEWPKTWTSSVFVENNHNRDPIEVMKALGSYRSQDLILTADGLSEVTLESSPLPVLSESAETTDVTTILALGGGAGITSEIAVHLAGQTSCRVVAVGRTAYPTGAPTTDRERSLLDTERRVVEAGGTFDYHQADVTDAAALGSVVAAVREAHGRIDGLIHGVGLLQDEKIERKSSETFRNVVHTKGQATKHLEELFLDDKELRFAILFSSVAAHTGNAGQTDYVASNEILGAIARRWSQSASYPVRTLLWSVWHETGMLPEPMRRDMARMGLPGIGNRAGAESFWNELVHGRDDDWVVISPAEILEFLAAPGTEVAEQDYRRHVA